MKNNWIKYVFATIVIGLILYAIYAIYGNKQASVSEQEQASKEPVVNQMVTHIRIPVVAFDTINPLLSKNQNIQDLARLIYEPLLTITKDQKISLCLAKEWSKQSETSYIIKLKENIVWHDKAPLQAKDVQFTIDRIKELGASCIYAYNVEKVHSVQVIDEATIRINLVEEVPFFEYYLTFPILSYQYYEGEDFITTSKNTHPVGTGRFKVSDENGNLTLQPNSNWWKNEQEETKLETIQIVKYQTMGEVYNDFKIGNIDLFTTTTNQLEQYIGTIGYQKKRYEGRQLDYLALNCAENILANVEVRKAIAYAIDVTNIVEGIYKGGYRISRFPLPEESFLYQDRKVKVAYQPESAKQFLTQAGWQYQKKYWQKNKDGQRQKIILDLVVNSNQIQRVQVAEHIKNTLADVGIEVHIKKVSDQQYQKTLTQKNYDMIITGMYQGLSPDLSGYFGANNIANYQNEEMNRFLQESKNIQDETLQRQTYQKMIENYEQQMPYIFLYKSQNTLVYSTKLVGEFSPNYYNVYEGIGTWYKQM